MRWPWQRRRPEAEQGREREPLNEPYPEAADVSPDSDLDSPGAVPEYVVVFMHLPKCGGTSLHEWMDRVLAPGMLSPERNRLPLEISHDRLIDFRHHRVFSGHFDVVDLQRFPGPQRRFTVFRDPVETIVSLYDFWRAHDDAFIEEHDLVGPRVASSRSFEEFVGDVDPRIVPDLDNTMVRTFTGLIRTNAPFADPEAALAGAIDTVAALDHVGHVGRLDATYAWLCDEFGIDRAVGAQRERRNVRGEWTEPHLHNVERTVVSPEAAVALEPLVWLDRRLVERFTG